MNTNTGKENSDEFNSGDRNSGSYNSGDRNSGSYNSGDYNSGSYNSGDYNSGHRNSGDYNSGHRNSGDCNSGDRNSGDYNSGDYNSGHRNSGYFNTNEPMARLFNKECDKKISEIDLPYVDIKVTEWIEEQDMTDEQKKNDPQFHVKKGTLIKRTYKDAWRLAWSRMDQSVKDRFLNLPNFCPEIFFEITGVDVRNPKESTCGGKVIEIDGKKYKLTEV